jgi:thiosulfate reductase cytochrome b subunit
MQRDAGARNAVLAGGWPRAGRAIHGGAVVLVTGSFWLGMAESYAHMAIDYAKCEGWLSVDADQALHAACKFLWAAIALGWL